MWPFKLKKEPVDPVSYHVLFNDKKGASKDAPDEDGMKLLGVFPSRGLPIATYFMESWLNRCYENWYYNEWKDEYQDQKTNETLGKVKKVHG